MVDVTSSDQQPALINPEHTAMDSQQKLSTPLQYRSQFQSIICHSVTEHEAETGDFEISKEELRSVHEWVYKQLNAEIRMQHAEKT